MNKKQTIEVFKTIRDVFPSFEVTQRKIDLWTSLLKNDNPALVMRNTENHLKNEKFPPAIAHISAPKSYEMEKKAYQLKVKKWEEEARGESSSRKISTIESSKER
ncbi:replicative helicase loader/inhibitor [Bacillus sp. Marseille-Q3570]|uniref:replicative helicase loader/inhibitor n=1 Tax=Bacillus sp. Marseille-Q3570 TaxID=2963522 RepID=UPI0021B76AA0|nr:replicative helicase loader/inhibitor [Bacillus sp. Marseille-Q3570]